MQAGETNIFDLSELERNRLDLLVNFRESEQIIEFFFKRALEHIPCTCEDTYTKRNLTAPDCPRCNYL